LFCRYEYSFSLISLVFVEFRLPSEEAKSSS
jgi:hypothetical protein